jgi:hypothetical protein
MTSEEFEALQCGDSVREDATGDVYLINQVRQPGFYAAVLWDAAKMERVNNRLHALHSGDGLSLVAKKPLR